MVYTFWNNKGGTGKTSLSFQVISEYARINPNKKILAIDLCPQSNLSELFLGGLVGNGSANLSTISSMQPRKTIGGYFEIRIQATFNPLSVNVQDFICTPIKYNPNIPSNIDLIAGDRLVEIQSSSLSSLANTQLPGVNARLAVLCWVKDLIRQTDDRYDTVFIDTNPSFAIHTQMGIVATDRLLVPIMADDSSRRAIANLFTLVYGLNLPSPIYNQYQFASVVSSAGLPLPLIHLVMRNRITQYMGEASAYGTVLNTISKEIKAIMLTNASLFTFNSINDGLVSVKDFGTTGVVAFAEGKPFSVVNSGTHTISGKQTKINQNMLDECIDAVYQIVSKI